MNTKASLLRLMAGTTALSCAFALPAFAQDEAIDLGSISLEVEGAGAVGDAGNPFTLSGMKTATAITDVPQSVTVVGREAFSKEQPRKVDQILNSIAGVQSQLYGYDSDTNWFYIRGFNSSDTGAFMDGLSLFSYGFGTFYVDPFLLERVEVLKGPASMLYGASSPGGIVNYVSRLPDGSEGTELGFTVDSEGSATASVRGSGTNGADLAWNYGIQAKRADGHGMFEAGFEGVAYGAVTKSFEDGSKLTVHLSYTNMDEDHVGGQFLPYYGTVAAAPYGYLGEYFNAGQPGTDIYKREQAIATGIYRRDVAGWAMVDTFRIGYVHLKEQYLYPFGYATSGFETQIPVPGSQLNIINFAHNSRANIVQNDLRFTREFDNGAVSHSLLFGLDMRQYRLTQTQASNTTTLDPVNPDYSVAPPALGSPYNDSTSTQKQLGVYAQDQIEWGDGWIATVNARYDIVWSDFVGRTIWDTNMDRRDEAFTARVAIAKKIGDVTPYLTFGTYFNPQALSVTSLNSDPETGHQVEAGVKWQLNETSLVTIAAFDITRNDVAQSFVNGGVFDSRTLGKVSSKGIEIEASIALNDEWRMKLAATKMRVKVDEFAGDATFVGKTPQSVAEEFGTLQLAWTPAAVDGLELRAGARYLGPTWADNRNTLKVEDAWLYDIGASWAINDTWSADFNVTNVTNERYISSCQSSDHWSTRETISSCWQGEGRVATLGVTTRF